MTGDIVYLAVYLLTEFLNYLLAYSVIFQADVSKRKGRWFAAACILLGIHCSLLYFFGIDAASTSSVATMAVIPTLLLTGSRKKYLLVYPFVVVGTSVFAISFTFLAGIFFHIPEYEVLYNHSLGLLCQCIPLALLLVVFFYQKRTVARPLQLQLGRSQYLLFYIGAICIFYMLSSVQLISEGDLSEGNINAYGLAVSVACIVFVLLILWNGIIVYREVQMKERNRVYEQYMKLQEEHFRQIMEQDEKMRRFRHDMNSHMEALRAYSSTGNNRELESYLQSILKSSAVDEVKHYTGSKGVDAVLRPLLEEAGRQGIQVEIAGALPESGKVSVYDLCTILSNLLRNAIEACERIGREESRSIQLKLASYNDQLFLLVKNTVEGEVQIRDGHLSTTKADSSAHGIGSENVLAAVRKYGGDLSYCCEDGWFTAEIVL